MTTRKLKITTQAQYKALMKKIDVLADKGDVNMTDKEVKEFRRMAIAAEEYEDTYDPIPFPKTIPEMVEFKMYQMKLTQTALAKKLGLRQPKLSQILNGKQGPDLPLVKALYEKLHIDPAFLLKNA